MNISMLKITAACLFGFAPLPATSLSARPGSVLQMAAERPAVMMDDVSFASGLVITPAALLAALGAGLVLAGAMWIGRPNLAPLHAR